jgi:hypothetical protein
MTQLHYELGPSAAPGWSRCAAKPNRERGIPNESSEHARWGTVAHDLSERTLTDQTFRPTVFKGWRASVIETPTSKHVRYHATEGEFEIDDEMLACVMTYVEFVRAIPGELHVEMRVPIDHVTGEPNGSGTSDAVILAGDEIVVIDLKGGRGVKVDAYEIVGEQIDLLTGEITQATRPNEQAALYGAGTVRMFAERGRTFKTIRLVIVQPRLNHVSEHVMTIEALDQFMDYLRGRAELTRDPLAPATPGEKQCKFCRAKASCPELQQIVLTEAIVGFEDMTATPSKRDVPFLDLGRAMTLVPLVEEWCLAVRGKLAADLLSGVPHEGWKLVQGRRGDRAWASGAAPFVAALLGEQGYQPRKLVTPTKAGDLLAKADPELWAALQDSITQSEGTPSVAPESDKRPALVRQDAADVFPDLQTEAAAPSQVADLF